MKLTKKIIAAVALAFAAQGVFAADSYLYWMVDPSVYNSISQEPTTFDYAKVSVDGGSTYLNWYQYDSLSGYSVSQGDKMYASAGGGTEAAYWGVFDYSPGTTFLFELYNDDNSVAGFMNVDWVNTSAIASGFSTAGVSPFALTSVVPEPTSGLLMLIGMAGLALKRKRA